MVLFIFHFIAFHIAKSKLMKITKKNIKLKQVEDKPSMKMTRLSLPVCCLLVCNCVKYTTYT